MFDSVFSQIGVILALAAIGGILAQWLKQPLIVAFIVVGILLGPSGFEMVSYSSEIELFARLGIALLLFVVGLKLDLHVIRTVGPVALASGLGQVFFTSVVGYLIALMLGFDPVSAIYIAVALTFSSTIIIVKLLSDKREVDALHGRIAVGFLIVQDIVVVLVMIGLTAYGQADSNTSLGWEAVEIILKGGAMLITVALLMRYVLPGLLHRLAHSTELLMLFAIAWAVIGATTGELLGFSKEVGAFLAGISIASTPYREQVAARLVSLRDFLLLFFFVELGATLDLSMLGSQVFAASIFSVFVLFGNPLIVMLIMGYMGYRKRTGFLAGLTVAQISEFSLILAALGLSLGHLNQEVVGLITLVGLITISASTYMILYSHQIYERYARFLSVFERRIPYREINDGVGNDKPIEILLVGLGRFGASVASNLVKKGCDFIAVDFDPETVRRHSREGYDVRYGDVENPEFVASLPLDKIEWVVSTVRDGQINRMLLHGLKQHDYKGKTAFSVSNRQEQVHFANEQVSLLLEPYADAAKEAVDRILSERVTEKGNE
jgi:Kef-type K+ transport system membrane component KefB